MKTPGIYTEINTQTQRTGLPIQDHRIVFVTGDIAAPSNPAPIYDTASANIVSGANSNAGRMIAAALTISQGVRVETMGRGTPISCTPTTLEFVPKVILPAGKEQIILRAVLEVNGEAVFHYNGDDGFADLSVDTGALDFNNESTPEWIANYLFLYSGIDLMRQMNVRNCFDYSPNGELVEGQPISLWGLEETVPDGMLSLPRIPADVKLTFKVIDNLPSNAVDFTLEQWGRDVSVYGCAIYDQSNAPQ